MSTASFIFTKILRHLVNVWRSKGYRIILFLDDGICVAENMPMAQKIAFEIHKDLEDHQFLIAAEKSDWNPKNKVSWLGFMFDFVSGTISVNDDRILNIENICSEIIHAVKTGRFCFYVKKVASLVGKIQSTGSAVGALTNVMTKYSHMCIETRASWNSKVMLTSDAVREIVFWKTNIRVLNSSKFVNGDVCTVEVYSDASGTGYGGYISAPPRGRSAYGTWTISESRKISTWLELEGVYRILSKLIYCFKNQIVRLYVDNLNVVRILSRGSMKQDLQNIAVNILNMCNINHVIIVPEWIPRENNTIADRLSRFAYTDCDDWMVSAELFQILNINWGPFTVDRFASELNKKCERFNSKIWLPGTEAVDALKVSWRSEFNWLVPPPSLIPAVLSKVIRESACGTLIVPKWHSAPYWPVLYPNGVLAEYISDVYFFPAVNNLVLSDRSSLKKHRNLQMAAFRLRPVNIIATH